MWVGVGSRVLILDAWSNDSRIALLGVDDGDL